MQLEKPNKIVNFFAEKGFSILILCTQSGYRVMCSSLAIIAMITTLYVNDPDLSNIP